MLTTKQQTRRTLLILWILFAAGVWGAAAGSVISQKISTDDMISKSLDISAVQIQQLNGQLTGHILTWMVVAFACTIPMLAHVSLALIFPIGPDEPATEVTPDPES